MADAIKAASNEETGLKKTSKMFQVPRSKLINKTNSKETDQCSTCLETSVVLQSWRLVNYCPMMGRTFFGLTTRSIERMTFELAIQNVHFQYSKEEHTGRRSVTLCAAFLDWGCASPKLLQQQEERDWGKQTSQNVSTFLSHFCNCCCCSWCWWLTSLPIVYSTMTNRISPSFRIKYTKFFPLKLSDGSLCLQQRGVHLWQLLPAWMPPWSYVPLLLVFPWSNVKAEYLDSGLPGSIAACHKAAWFQKESLTHWFKYFSVFRSYLKWSPTEWPLFSFEEYRGDWLCSG